MTKNCADVIVVGCGPIGAYAAWKFAEQGVDVLALESKKGNQAPSHIGDFHFDRQAFDHAEIPLPPKSKIICTYPGLCIHSPNPKIHLNVEGVETWALDLNGFIRSLRTYAKSAGARISYGARVTTVIKENGRVTGVRAKTPRGMKEFRAPIVVDASGALGAVRRHIPSMAFSHREMAFSVYMEYWSDPDPTLDESIHSYLEHQAWTAKYPSYWIVGMGRPLPITQTKKLFAEWAKQQFKVKKKVLRRVTGTIPFAFSPPTFVDDGVLVLGDAAATNKPFNGEGIASGMHLPKLSSEHIASAVRDGGSRSSLWEINRQYYGDIGAKFTFLRAMALETLRLTTKERSATFELGLLTAEDLRQTFTQYEVKRPPALWLAPLLRLARNPLLAKKFGTMIFKSTQITKHVRHYPSESKFSEWAKTYRKMAAALSKSSD